MLLGLLSRCTKFTRYFINFGKLALMSCINTLIQYLNVPISLTSNVCLFKSMRVCLCLITFLQRLETVSGTGGGVGVTALAV